MDRLLFIEPGPAMPSISPAYSWRYECLSQYFSGDIITLTFKKDCVKQKFGSFNFHPFLYSRYNAFYRNIYAFIKTFLIAYRLCRTEKGKYLAIISSNPLNTGLNALFIGKVFKIKTVIEVNGDFKEAFKFGREGEITLSFIDKIKEKIALSLISFCLMRCDCVRLLYKEQLVPLHIPSGKTKSIAVFPDFVPILKFINHPKTDNKYILLLGFPWYLKGADILIRAFNTISSAFPDYSLKIHGWNPSDNDYFEKLTEGNGKIHLGKALKYTEVIEVMSACSLYVLASRTEAMGRVLIEAMACRKPIIASNVGGVSSIVKDGYNGLLFEKENVADLTDKLKRVLSNATLRETLAQNALDYAQNNLSELRYSEHFKLMIDSLGNTRGR